MMMSSSHETSAEKAFNLLLSCYLAFSCIPSLLGTFDCLSHLLYSFIHSLIHALNDC